MIGSLIDIRVAFLANPASRRAAYIALALLIVLAIAAMALMPGHMTAVAGGTAWGTGYNN